MSFILKSERLAGVVLHNIVGAALFLATLASFAVISLVLVGVLGA